MCYVNCEAVAGDAVTPLLAPMSGRLQLVTRLNALDYNKALEDYVTARMNRWNPPGLVHVAGTRSQCLTCRYNTLLDLYNRTAEANNLVRADPGYPKLSRGGYSVRLRPYGKARMPGNDEECKAAVRGVLEGLRELHVAGVSRDSFGNEQCDVFAMPAAYAHKC